MNKTKKRAKRIIHEFRMDEVSVVDKPAQEGARVVLMKRATDDDVHDDQTLTKKVWMTSSSDGHAHLVDDIDYDGQQRDGGDTSWQSGSGDNSGHSHPWIRNTDGTITVGDSNGHSHELLMQQILIVQEDLGEIVKTEIIDGVGVKFGPDAYGYVPDRKNPETWKLRLFKSPDGPPDRQVMEYTIKKWMDDVPEKHREEVRTGLEVAWHEVTDESFAKAFASLQENNDMDTELEKKNDELQKAVDKLTVDLTGATVLAGMNDLGKAYLKDLEGAPRDDFMKMESAARIALIEKAQADDDIFEVDGSIIRKSEVGASVFALLKSQNARIEKGEARISVAECERQDALLAKRAADELPHLPGEDVVKVALLKAVTGIDDEDIRKKVEESLKANNEAMRLAFEKSGTSLGGESNSAEDKLTALAKKLAQDKSIGFEKAYSEVLDTDEGKALYEEAHPRT